MTTFKLWWNAEEVYARILSGGEKGVRDVAQALLDESKKQVPLDTGALQRSGAVDSEGLTATISYDTPYAVRWHENDACFQRGRKKKYLEDPVNDPGFRKNAIKYIAEQIRL